MKNIVIFGAPGSGKGTQSDLMIEKYGFGHISTGDVLRNEIKNGTELGKTAKGYIDNGQLIPDELMIDILASVYDTFGTDHKGVIFDGFPRTIPQAEALKEMLSKRGHCVAAMIELDVPEDELMTRLIKRGQESGRSDDNAETIKAFVGKNAIVSGLVDNIANIPTESVDKLLGASEALGALGIDTKSLVTSAAENAVDAAVDAATDAVENAKDAVVDKANEAVENAKEKAGEAVDKGAAAVKKGLGL